MPLWDSLLCLYLEDWVQFYSFYLKKQNKPKNQKQTPKIIINNWTKTKRATGNRCVENDATGCNNPANKPSVQMCSVRIPVL